MIDFLTTSQMPWMQLGLTLTHFLWQGTAICLLLAATLWLLRRASAGSRYLACGMAMVLMATCPVLTFWYVHAHPLPTMLAVRQDGGRVPVVEPIDEPPYGPTAIHATAPPEEQIAIFDSTAEFTPPFDANAVAALGDVGAEDPTASAGLMAFTPELQSTPDADNLSSSARPHWPATALTAAAAAWLLGVAVLGLRLMIGWWGLYRLRRREIEPLPDPIARLVAPLRDHLRLGPNVRVYASRKVDGPLALGLIRPMVLLPVSVLCGCPVELVEAMIAHELAHIRRFDLWINVFQRIVETLLFYHPGVWWVSSRMRIERELCADDLAVKVTGRRVEYAEALVELARAKGASMSPLLSAAMGHMKTSLAARVHRVLQLPPPQQARFWLAGPLSLLLVAALLLVGSIHSAVRADQADAASSAVAQPSTANESGKTGDETSGPEPSTEERTFFIAWDNITFQQAAENVGQMQGLSVIGLNLVNDRARKRVVNLKIARPLTYDEVLTIFNEIAFDFGCWMIRQDEFLVIRDADEWFRYIPPQKMFKSEADYRKARLPAWDVALVTYEPQHWPEAKKLADWAMDYVPLHGAVAQTDPTGSKIEVKGFACYVDRLLQHLHRGDALLASSTTDADTRRQLEVLQHQARRAAILHQEQARLDQEQALGDAPFQARSRRRTIDARSYRDRPMVVVPDGSRRIPAPESESSEVPLLARTDGFVAEVKPIKVGQRVKKGDLLMRLEDDELRIDLEEAQVRLDEAKEKLSMLRPLQGGPDSVASISTQELKAAERAVVLAKLDLQRRAIRLKRTRITSPIDGVVVYVIKQTVMEIGQHVKVGDLVAAIQPLPKDQKNKEAESKPARTRAMRSGDQGL